MTAQEEAAEAVEETKMASEQQPKVETAPEEKAKPKHTKDDMFNAVRFGSLVVVKNILGEMPELVHELDNQGYSAVHWAAKSGSVDMMEVLVEAKANLNVATAADSRMLPIHWAASDGKLSTLKFLLDHRCDINALDGNGCTPAIVAAQHEEATCVIFLVQNGADLTLTDNNGDTALHWSCYKGFIELTGLCSYLCPQTMEKEDNYGQKPIHLAALRGNADVVEYLVADCGVDTNSKDKNGLTPLALAMKKKQLASEWTLRRLASTNIIELVKGLGTNRLRDPKIVSNIFMGSNEREISAWPWRIVFGSNLMGTMYSIYFAFHQSLNDLTLLHTINTMVQTLWWFFFYMCLTAPAAAVYDEKCRNKEGDITEYENALAKIGTANNDIDIPNLCHTCRVRKPLRSKHCKFQRRCINKFDHYCPFVYNTVSRDNYKYFTGCISVHMVVSVCWMVTAGYFVRREEASYFFYFFAFFLFMWMVMVGGLTQYHTTLIIKNMTTNEHINSARYKYLQNSYGIFDNPFDRGDQAKNIMDGLFPMSKMYYTREDAVRDRMRLLEGEDIEGDELLRPQATMEV